MSTEEMKIEEDCGQHLSCYKKGKRFYDVPGSQYYDFNFIDNVVEGLISSLNFNYKKVTFLKFGNGFRKKNVS